MTEPTPAALNDTELAASPTPTPCEVCTQTVTEGERVLVLRGDGQHYRHDYHNEPI